MSVFQDQLFQFGGAAVGVPVLADATYFFCDPNANANGNGSSMSNPAATIQQVIDRIEDSAINRAVVVLAPGQYDETVTISRPAAADAGPIVFYGAGPRGSVYIEPSTEDAGGMVCHRDDVTLINVGVAGEDETSAVALTVTGARFRAYASKLEGGAKQVLIGPGTDAQITAGTRGNAADSLFEDCELCWGTDGFVLTNSDYGACTQLYLRECRFHDLTNHMNEVNTATVSILFRGLNVWKCTFEDAEDGTAPTAFILLNDDNGNTGQVANCVFPSAINSGKNLVSTAVHWVSNFHTGGVSTGQPS